MAENGWTTAVNGCEWFEMAVHFWKCLLIAVNAVNGCKWLNMVKKGWKWLCMA